MGYEGEVYSCDLCGLRRKKVKYYRVGTKDHRSPSVDIHTRAWPATKDPYDIIFCRSCIDNIGEQAQELKEEGK